ncbi:diaminopimelate decarboxylase family protein [Parvibium lacunae]|uniref:Pyridoxal-dependent decarboxylase n=1 Tax=Parvibium lacunae TaxID=1888893 RepID=A0A368L154_9BURK|nr:pyridoxal-dependent decarboxylase [Parvibium lacunae]RCS57044.1 pyridoxal-dependent decarboxylase [Parvibium lacunae]
MKILAYRQQAKEALRYWLRQRIARRYPAQHLPPAQWHLAWEEKQGTEQAPRLMLQGHALHALAERYGTPLHVVNAAQLQANLAGFQQAPLCRVYYSYKTNPIPGLLAYLHQHGAGAEVISEYELWLARQLGVPPERIIFNGPAKSDRALRWAIEHSIQAIHANHLEELQRIAALAQTLGKRARVGLRVTHGGWQGQFGLSLAQGEAAAALAWALKHPHLEVVSLHCHRGFLIRTLEDLDGHLAPLLAFCAESHAQHGWLPTLLDIGGSLAIPSVEEHDAATTRRLWTFYIPPSAPNPALTLSPAAYSQAAQSKVAAFYQSRGWPLPEIALEPGRALTGNAQMLLTRVLELRHAQPAIHAVLDAGISIARSAREQFHQLFPLQAHSRPTQLYRLVGPICHPGDTLYPAWNLPQLALGETLAIMDSGAYFTSDASSFAFPQPGVLAVLPDGEICWWRQTETYQDMVAADSLPLPPETLSW